jgi:hypothetical protein
MGMVESWKAIVLTHPLEARKLEMGVQFLLRTTDEIGQRWEIQFRADGTSEHRLEGKTRWLEGWPPSLPMSKDRQSPLSPDAGTSVTIRRSTFVIAKRARQSNVAAKVKCGRYVETMHQIIRPGYSKRASRTTSDRIRMNPSLKSLDS